MRKDEVRVLLYDIAVRLEHGDNEGAFILLDAAVNPPVDDSREVSGWLTRWWNRR